MSDENAGNTKTAAADDTAKFLLTCIAHAADNKINWKGVGENLDLIPNTAAKRLERLFKAHGIDKNNPNGGTGDKAPATPKPKGGRGKKASSGDTPKTPGSKKRKIQDVVKEDGEEEEQTSGSKPSLFGNDDEDIKAET